MRSATTTLALVGHSDNELVLALASVASNISVETALSTNNDEMQALWRRAQARASIYTVVSFDPLQALVDRWAGSLESGDPIALSSHTIAVPDYYLVDLNLGEPHRSWYLQLLFELAPQRIISVDGTVAELYRTIADLPYGPGLPPNGDLEKAARRFVPTPGLRAAFASSP